MLDRPRTNGIRSRCRGAKKSATRTRACSESGYNRAATDARTDFVGASDAWGTRRSRASKTFAWAKLAARTDGESTGRERSNAWG